MSNKLMTVFEEMFDSLDTFEIEDIYENVDRLWLILFEMHRKGEFLTEHEKMQIKMQFEKIQNFLSIAVGFLSFSLNGKLIESTLKKRSGIQFFLDLLSNTNYELKDELRELDDELKNWAKDETYFVKTVPNGIPESHFWWNLFIRKDNDSKDRFFEVDEKIVCSTTDEKLANKTLLFEDEDFFNHVQKIYFCYKSSGLKRTDSLSLKLL